MTTLAEIESAVAALPREQKYALYKRLEEQLRRATTETSPPPHCVLDIPTVALGPLLRPLGEADDLLDEMLEGRA